MAGRFTQGDWLVELGIVASVVGAILLIVLAGIFEARPASASGLPANVTISGVPGPRTQSFLKTGAVVLDRGLDDGGAALSQIELALKIAQQNVQNRAQLGVVSNASSVDGTVANLGGSAADALRAFKASPSDLADFCELGIELSLGDEGVRHVPLNFHNMPLLRGCLIARPNPNVSGMTQFAMEIAVASEQPLTVCGFQRAGVRFLLLLNMTQTGLIGAGRMRVAMPAVGRAVGDGLANDYYKIGDELAWSDSATCAGWILGRPADDGLFAEIDPRGLALERRHGSLPPQEMLKRVASVARELLVTGTK